MKNLSTHFEKKLSNYSTIKEYGIKCREVLVNIDYHKYLDQALIYLKLTLSTVLFISNVLIIPVRKYSKFIILCIAYFIIKSYVEYLILNPPDIRNIDGYEYIERSVSSLQDLSENIKITSDSVGI